MKIKLESTRPTNPSENSFAGIMETELDRDLGGAEKHTLWEIITDYAHQRNLRNLETAHRAIRMVIGDSVHGLRDAIHKRNPKISEEDLNDLFREVDEMAGFVDPSSLVDPKDFQD